MLENTNGDQQALEVDLALIFDQTERGQYVSEFNQLRKQTATSIIAMCKVVCQANQSLTTDQYLLFAKEIQFDTDLSTLRKYQCIGKSADLFQQYIDCLPRAWTTLYELTKIETTRLSSLFAKGAISQSTTGAQATELILLVNKPCANLHKPPTNRMPAQSQTNVDSNKDYTLSVQFDSTPTPEVLVELQDLINEFMLAKDVICNLSLGDFLLDIVKASEEEAAECA